MDQDLTTNSTKKGQCQAFDNLSEFESTGRLVDREDTQAVDTKHVTSSNNDNNNIDINNESIQPVNTPCTTTQNEDIHINKDISSSEEGEVEFQCACCSSLTKTSDRVKEISDPCFEARDSPILIPVVEALELVFEFPFLITNGSGIIFTNSTQDIYLLCHRCATIIKQLYTLYKDLLKMLDNEGQIVKRLKQQINTMLPMEAKKTNTNKNTKIATNQRFISITKEPLSIVNHEREPKQLITRRKRGRPSKQPKNSNSNSTLKAVSTNSRKQQKQLQPSNETTRETSSRSRRHTARYISTDNSSSKTESLTKSSCSNSKKSSTIRKNEHASIVSIPENNMMADMNLSGSSLGKNKTRISHRNGRGKAADNLHSSSAKIKLITQNKKTVSVKKQNSKRKNQSMTNSDHEQMAQQQPHEMYQDSNIEGTETGRGKSKRIRNWKKETWIDKAKNDPTRTCDVCDKSFIFPAVMIRHKKIVHQGLKPYRCEHCGKNFTQKVILNKHTCDFSKESENRDLLQMSREVELRKYDCSTCGKRFKYPNHLSLHEMNHRDERPFSCDQCKKTFRRPDHLKYHIRIVHVDEKRFICTTCGQQFKSISSLRAHEKKHTTGDQGNLCNICGKSIKSMYQMSRHQKTHQDELPFSCHICGKRFKMKDYLGQHLRRGKSCKPGLQQRTINTNTTDTGGNVSTSSSSSTSLITTQNYVTCPETNQITSSSSTSTVTVNTSPIEQKQLLLVQSNLVMPSIISKGDIIKVDNVCNNNSTDQVEHSFIVETCTFSTSELESAAVIEFTTAGNSTTNTNCFSDSTAIGDRLLTEL